MATTDADYRDASELFTLHPYQAAEKLLALHRSKDERIVIYLETLFVGMDTADTDPSIRIQDAELISLILNGLPLALLEIVCDPNLFPNPGAPTRCKDPEPGLDGFTHLSPEFSYLVCSLSSFIFISKVLKDIILLPATKLESFSPMLLQVTREVQQHARTFFDAVPKFWSSLWFEIEKRGGYTNVDPTLSEDSAVYCQLYKFLMGLFDITSFIIEETRRNKGDEKLYMTEDMKYLGHILLFLWLFLEDETARCSSMLYFLELGHKESEARVHCILEEIFLPSKISCIIIDQIILDLRCSSPSTKNPILRGHTINTAALHFFGFISSSASILPSNFQKESQELLGNLIRVITLSCRKQLCIDDFNGDEGAVRMIGTIDAITGLGVVLEQSDVKSDYMANQATRKYRSLESNSRHINAVSSSSMYRQDSHHSPKVP
ncbi:hypothetical protein C8Q75DRAFT_379470 [Abortiporus biennis]|nr:hypothetical protein C8Q75DRAFT_379470 [Abortiporus biennis]